MSRFSLLPALPRFALLLALAGCGGGGDSGDSPPSGIGTLAYVTTECRDGADGFSESQALHILHGDRDVTVMETPRVSLPGQRGLCRGFTSTSARFGDSSIAREAFQGVAVSPDGAAVVFEVTDDFSVSPPLPLHLPPEQKGIFSVGADGSGLRKLGPPSRLPSFLAFNTGGVFVGRGPFAFSPDGRMVAFVDKGPDAAGNEAGQVWALDVRSGVRSQVTQLPRAVPLPNLPSDAPSVVLPVFIDNQTIGFSTFANPDGMNSDPCGCPLDFPVFAVSLSGGTPKRLPLPVASPDSRIIPTYVITGDQPAAVSFPLTGKAQNPPGLIFEIFVVDGSNLLQLTNFQRVDTSPLNPIIGVDRQTVFFEASANPPELDDSNPLENCQIFSIDRLGNNLRQLTQFGAGQHTTNGCFFDRPPGCAVGNLTQDSKTRTVVFYSSCDPPRGTNPFGAQLFAMRPDGSDLRQLTHTRGVVTQADRTTIAELPGPFAYGPYAP